MGYTEEERQKIGEVVRRARVGKGLDKEPAARAAKVNSITWKRVEDAESVRDASLGKILTSLGLPDAQEVLQGDGAIDFEEELAAVSAELHRAESELEQAVRTRDDETRRVLENLVVELYTRRSVVTAELDHRRHAEHARSVVEQKLEELVSLSYLADEVDGSIPATAPDPDDDPGDIESYISDVDHLVSAAEELTDAVHELVLEGFDGDLARLRQMKRDRRRRNLAKRGIVESPLPPFGDPETEVHLGEKGSDSASDEDTGA